MATGVATSGNDSFFLVEGDENAVIDGLGGIDTVFINWPRTSFFISSPDINGVTTISSASGAGIRIKNVEFVQFQGGANPLYTVPQPSILNGDSASNALVGGVANDTLTGNGAADVLTGGQGGDKFRYVAKTDSTAAAFDTIVDFQAGDAIEFSGIANVRLFATQFQFQGNRAATIAAINSNPNFLNALVSFSDGVDGWLYVSGAGTGTDFDGTLIKLQGRTTVLGLVDIIGVSASFTVPALSIAATSASKVEGSGGTTPFTFTVTRTGDLTASSTVLWSVAGSSGSPADATDFNGGVLPSGSLSFAATETSKVITINVLADTLVESNEGFTLTLASATGATLTTASASGLINNDDFGKTVNLQTYSWKSHTLLDVVSAQVGNNTQISNASGAVTFDQITGATLALTATRSTSIAESQAVNLQDAIAILKMIVGLEVNGVGKPLSPYQVIAADYDGNGAIGLNDAISVLKHVVGLPVTDPQWRFVNELDPVVLAATNPTVPATVAATISADLSVAPSPVHVGLVGILIGDVDGSFVGPQGSTALTTIYFDDLHTSHGLPLAQFGIYPP